MIGLQYTLRLQEPILANSLAGDTNSARTLPYVPGGLIRGALIAAYLSDSINTGANAKDEKFRRLFLDGRTRYLHAWPMRQEKRGLPMPASLIVNKDDLLQDENSDPADIFNLAATSFEEIKRMAANEDAKSDDFETVFAELAWLPGSTLHTQEPSLQFNLHTQRDAVFGRAREDSGAVFRYEALPAGLRLQGIIFITNKDDLKELENLLPQGATISLGKSRTAGYGRAVIEEKPRPLPKEWREWWKWPTSEETDEKNSGEHKLILTFLSPAIIRDANGQFTLDPKHALSARLRVPASTLEQDKAFCKPEIVGGFNRTWGLPLPQAWAIKPGSVFVYKLTEDTKPTREDLLELERTGLGERRAEGFGSIALDWRQPKSLSWKQESFSLESKADKMPLSEDAVEMGRMMQKRLLKKEMEEHLRNAVRRTKIVSYISNSQLSRWRVIVRAALSQEANEARLRYVLDFAGNKDNKPKPTWRKLEHVRIQGIGSLQHASLTEWITKILDEKNKAFWEQMGAGANPPEIRLGELAPLSPDTTMITDYKLRLIDAVLAKHAKPQEL